MTVVQGQNRFSEQSRNFDWMLDHVIPLNERHLKRLLAEYIRYYHVDRTHLGLEKDTPKSRVRAEHQRGSRIVSFPRLGGLHHRYDRQAA